MYKILVILLANDFTMKRTIGQSMTVVEFNTIHEAEVAFKQLNDNPMVDVTKLY